MKCHHLAAYLKLQSSQNGVGARDSPPVWLFRPVQYGGTAPSLLILWNGEVCFSLKLKMRAAIYRESTPPQLSIFKWYLNTAAQAVTQLVPVRSVTRSLTF